MELTRLFTQPSDWLTSWLVQVCLIVVATLLLNFLLRRFLNRLQQKAVDSQAYWDDAVVKALRKPAAVLVLLLGLSFVLDIIRQHTELALFSALGPLRTVGVVVLFAWFLMCLIREGEEAIIAKGRAGRRSL